MVTHVSQVLCAGKFVTDESATNQARKTHVNCKYVTGLASQL